jgi:hypothetical protein
LRSNGTGEAGLAFVPSFSAAAKASIPISVSSALMIPPYAGSRRVIRRGKQARAEIEAQFEAEVAALRRSAEEIGASDQLTEEESAIKLQAACKHAPPTV